MYVNWNLMAKLFHITVMHVWNILATSLTMVNWNLLINTVKAHTKFLASYVYSSNVIIYTYTYSYITCIRMNIQHNQNRIASMSEIWYKWE